MKIYNSNIDGNESADLEPARYFNLAIEQINKIQEWLKDTNEPAQALLVHIDMFNHIASKYPAMGKRRKRQLNISEIKETFFKWYDRVEKKIPAEYREGIKESANSAFSDLESIGTNKL